MIKIIAAPVQSDADVCNALQAPSRGCPAGGGIHIVIPADWQARIAAGQEVPGCTYAHLEADGSLYVTDAVQTGLAIPAVVNALPAALQTEVPALQTKLAASVGVGVVTTDAAPDASI